MYIYHRERSKSQDTVQLYNAPCRNSAPTPPFPAPPAYCASSGPHQQSSRLPQRPPKQHFSHPSHTFPTAWAYHEWCKANTTNPSRRAQLEPLVWTYALSTTVGVAAVSAVQAGVGYTLTTLFYGTGEARSLIINEAMRNTTAGLSAETILQRAEIAKSWKYLSLMTLIFFTAAGVGEEVLKFLPVLYARRRGTAQDRKPRDRAYLDYVMASSLAFGVIEGIGFIFTACGKNGETGGKLALSVLERLLLGSTGHVLMAVLSALRATRRGLLR